MSTRTIRRTWLVEGVLTDVTTATLSNSAAAYGVKRNDTSAVVVAAGTAMTKVDTGTYEYTFTEPADGLSYTAWVKFVYDGSTYYFEHDLPVETSAGMATTYSLLQDAIGFYLYGMRSGWNATQTTNIDRVMYGGLRRFYLPPPLDGSRYGHQWSFLRPVASLSLLASEEEYDLPAGFAGMDGRMSFAPGDSVTVPPIQIVPEFVVRQRLAEVPTTGRPTIAAYRPKTISYSTGTRYELIVWPTPDDSYTLYYRYRVKIEPLSEANPYPPGGEEHTQTIMEACLAEAELQINDADGRHAKTFREMLLASISHDRLLSAAPTLGYNEDRSDQPYDPFTAERGYQDYTVEYSGYT